MTRLRSGLISLVLLWAATSVAAQGFTTLKGHGGPIMGIAVSPDGQVATASFDNSVGLWEGREPSWFDGHDAAVNDVTFGPFGLISASDDFKVIDWGNRTPRVLGAHKGKVTDVEVSPDGKTVASASWDGMIGLWSIDGASKQLSPGRGGLNDLVFLPDGQALIAATSTGDVFLQSLDGSQPTAIARHGFGVNVLVLGAQQHWLAYGAVDGVTRVIDPTTGAQIADFSLDRRPILAMAYHAATGQLAVGDGQGYIMVIDTATWRIERDFRATRQGPIWALAFDPEGQVIYAGGLDDVAYAWPVNMLDSFDPIETEGRSFQRAVEDMPNGERQFMRKCSICHALTAGSSRKAGPTLFGIFGRPAGKVSGYNYSPVLDGSDIIWSDVTIDQLFDRGPDHFIPGSKMPMQRIAAAQDRRDLIDFLKQATR